MRGGREKHLHAASRLLERSRRKCVDNDEKNSEGQCRRCAMVSRRSAMKLLEAWGWTRRKLLGSLETPRANDMCHSTSAEPLCRTSLPNCLRNTNGNNFALRNRVDNSYRDGGDGCL